MVGPDMNAMGGMASVISTYKACGFLERWAVVVLTTYVEGPVWRRLAIGLGALSRFLGMLMMGHVAFAHLHVAQRSSFLRKSVFVMAARLFRRPVILHVHGSQFDEYYAGSNRLYRRYIRWIIESCTWVIALSDQWQRWFEQNTGNRQIVRIYNPVLLPAARLSTDAQPDDPPALLFLGRIGHRKGAFDLLQAVAALNNSGVPYHLHLCGDGDVGRARAMTIELGIESHVTIPGWIGANERQRLLASSTAFVLPSYHEGLPVAILEAMSAGIPVISSPVGGIPDAITNGVEGLLVPAGEIGQLTTALRQLLCNPQLAQAMGNAARIKVAATFVADKALAPLDSLYSRIRDVA